MSKSLVKLVDISLFPATVVVLGKLVGIFATLYLFDIDFTFKTSSFDLFSLGPTVSDESVRIVTSYSDLFMYGFIVTYFSIVLFRAIFLHSTHVKPTLVSKLANKNLLKLIQSSYELYHSAFMGIVFLWVSTIVILVNTFFNDTYIWVGIVSLITTIVLTVLLFQDVFREIDTIKSKPGRYNWS